MSLQDLPLEILLEISKLHPWVAYDLACTIKKVGLFSLENDTKKWFKVEEDKHTFILIKSIEEPYFEKLRHSWDYRPAILDSANIHRGQPADESARVCVQMWYEKGILHRDNDRPAIILSSGINDREFKYENLHRNNDRFIVDVGTEWFECGSMRLGIHKLIHYDGSQWFKDGKCHRDNDAPAVIYFDDSKEWYKEGKQHRDGDNPSLITAGGSQKWYKEGKCHRDNDLPAAMFATGEQEWWKDGKRYYLT